MCDSITNGGPRYIATSSAAAACCPPANVIIASNVLDTNGNVIAGNVISQDGTFTGNLIVSGSIISNVIFSALNVSGTINASYFSGDGGGLANLNSAALPDSGVTAGQYGDFANVSQISVDQHGLITNASNVAFVPTQWTTVDGNVAYQNGVSIGTLAAPAPGSNLRVLGTANIDTLNVTSLFANSATVFGSQTLNVLGTSNLHYAVGDGGGLFNLQGASISGNVARANVALVVSQPVQPNITQVGTLVGLYSTGNILAHFFQGEGNALTNIQSSVLVGNVESANTALVVSQRSQPNITSVGTLTGLAVSGILSAGFVSGNGSGISNLNSANLVGNVAQANVALVVSQADQPNITQVGTLTGLYSSGNITAVFFLGGGNALSNVQSSTLVGNVAQANVAMVVSQPSQPNITSLGTLTSLSVTGSLGAGTISGDGQGLFGIHGTAIIDTVATANSVVQAAQPNITSVGTLTGLNVQGLLVASNGSGLANLNASNIASGTLDASRLPTSGVSSGLYGSGANVSQVTVDQYGRVTAASNIAITASQWTGAVGNPIYYQNFVGVGAPTTPTATLQVTGNVYASNAITTPNLFFTNSIQATNLPTSGVSSGLYGSGANVSQVTVDQYGRVTAASNIAITASQWTTVNSNVAFSGGVSIGTIANPPVGSNLYVLGTATISNITANGSSLFSLNSANLVGNVANANVAMVVSQPAQPNITSVGILTSLNVAGNSNIGNTLFAPNIVSAGFTSNATNTVFNFDTLVMPFISSTTLNVATTSNINSVISSTLNVYGVSNLTAIWGSLATPVQPNITQVGTLSGLYSTGNVTAAFFSGGGNALTNIQSSTTTALMAGVVTQAAQLNITSVGTLTGLNVQGLLIASNASGLSNINASNLVGNVANANVALVVSQPAQPNITSVGTLTNLVVSNSLTTSNVTANLINVMTTSNLANITTNSLLIPGSMTANSTNTTFFFNTLTIPFLNSTTLNVSSTSNLDTLTLTGEPNLTTLYASGNIFSTNSVSTTNVYATAINVGTVNAWAVSNLTTLVVSNNIFASNSLTTGNVFVSNGLDVGPGTLGTNVVIFSNISGGANTFIMDSRGRVSIGAGTQGGGSLLSFGQTIANKILTLFDANNGQNPATATNFYGFGVSSAVLRYQVNSTSDIHAFYGGSTEYARITNTGISILTGAAPSANLHVAGNIYASNALQTTNVISSNINVSYTANIANLVVASNILPGPSGNTYITGNVVVSGNVFTSLGTPLGEGGGYYFSLPSDIALQIPYTGALYGTTYPLSVGLSNGWTITGTSTLITVTTNGNFKFSKAGAYKLSGVFQGSTDNITGLAVGSNVADIHGTDQGYMYRYTTFVTQNPTELIEIPFDVTDASKYYYLDLWCVDGGALKATATGTGGTYLTITPLQGGGLASGGPGGTPGTQWISSGQNIYFPNSIGVGTINPQYNVDVSGGTTASKFMLVSNISSLGGPTLNITSNVQISANLAVGGVLPTVSPPYALYVKGQGYFSDHITFENFAGFRNRLANGTFRVISRANTLTISNVSSYNSNAWVCDRWRADVGNLSTSNVLMTVKRDLPVGTTNGFTQCANVYVSRAWGATLDNTWICPLTQTVEASFAFDFKFGSITAKPTVFTFWANTNITGDFSVVVRSRIDNTYFANLVHMVSGTNWNRYTVYMPPCYIGTWGSDTQGYMDVCILGVAYGTGRSNVAPTMDWTASPGYAPMACTGATNWAQTQGAYIQITGPQLEQGTIATPFEVRPLTETIRYCQRFYETNPQTQYAAALGSGRINSVPYVVTKRNNANVSVYTTFANLASNTNIGRFTSITTGGTYANTAITSYTSSEYGYTFTFTQGSGSNKIDEAQFVWAADAEIY